jgi:Kef-type K+ transport system membrane component KefB
LDKIVAVVLGDIALVLAVSSLLGVAARRCGQPAVIGQILTGVLLGPSVLGRLPGHLTGHLFPHQELPYLNVLAQVGVTVFVFAVGYEIEFRSLHGHGRTVPLVAVGGLVVPMSLGVTCALLLRPDFSAIGNNDNRSFVLFLGVAVSITALPVLAAIVRERGLAGTTVGVIAIAAAGIMDVVAWLALAAVLVITGHSGILPWPATLGVLIGFVAVMLGVVRPAVSWWTSRRQAVLLSPTMIAFVLAMGGAWVTASLGLHPLFGALLAGLTMRGRNRVPDADVLRSMEQTADLLLPLFFVVTGLSLDIGAVNGNSLALLALVFAIATLGKLAPAYAASRLCGLRPRQSAVVATLVNTRGLTELIALNVGLDDGIIDERLFTILVLMALITTCMTGPLLSLIGPIDEQQTILAKPAQEIGRESGNPQG